MSGPYNNYNEYWRCEYCDQTYYTPNEANDCLCPIKIKEQELVEVINAEECIKTSAIVNKKTDKITDEQENLIRRSAWFFDQDQVNRVFKTFNIHRIGELKSEDFEKIMLLIKNIDEKEGSNHRVKLF